MKRSFKLHLFVRMFIAALVILWANRQISQSFLLTQTAQLMHAEMAADLSTCHDKINDTPDFIRCAQGLEPSKLYNSVKESYLLCPDASVGKAQGVCGSALQAQNTWQTKPSPGEDGIEFAEFDAQEGTWLAVRFANTPQAGMLLLNQSWVSHFVDQLWKIRDRNMAKSIPPLTLSIMLLALYMVYIMLRPLRLIQNQMSQLNSQNLFSEDALVSPYREFNRLTEVYQDLRKRLADSFSKARRFSSDVAHELRTPLSILRGNTERMIADLPAGSPMQVQVRLMSDEVERLITITEKLLLLSRADANSLQLTLTRVDMSALLSELVEDARSFHHNLSIKHQIQADVLWLCDHALVHQLIQNLYTNAVKYNQADGWIAIQLRCADGQLCLTLENPSPHITQDLPARAFERFYRSDASRTRDIDGFGLGLSICQEIARLHQGALTLTITPNNTVQLTLTAPVTPV